MFRRESQRIAFCPDATLSCRLVGLFVQNFERQEQKEADFILLREESDQRASSAAHPGAVCRWCGVAQFVLFFCILYELALYVFSVAF